MNNVRLHIGSKKDHFKMMSVIRRKSSNSQDDWKKQRQKRNLIQQAGPFRNEGQELQEITISLESSKLYALNYMLPNLNQSLSATNRGNDRSQRSLGSLLLMLFASIQSVAFFHLLGLGTRQQSNKNLVSFDLPPQLFVMTVKQRFQILCQFLVSLALDNRLIAVFS